MVDGPAVKAVERALNGDADSVDPPVRRALLALADEIDDLNSTLLVVRNLLVATAGSIITGIVVALTTAG